MIYYLLLPLMAIGLVVFQTTLADILFSGRLMLELSLVAVIYAGFRLDLIRGIYLALMMGFVFDCVSGSILGLFTMIYLLIFMFSFLVSWLMADEKYYLIALFGLICSVLESLILILLYRVMFQMDMLNDVFFIFLPQALLISVFSVGIFYMMRKIEGLGYGETIRSPQRTGTGGISTEA